MVEEWFEEHSNDFEVLTSQLAICTTAHLRESSGIHGWMGQGCLGSKRKSNTISGRVFHLVRHQRLSHVLIHQRSFHVLIHQRLSHVLILQKLFHATPPKYPQYPQQAFHDQSSQEPKIPNQQYPKLPDPPLKPPPQACEVTPGTRVPCGVPEISAAVCESINCCFDGRQCYFPNAVTVQCTKDAQFIVVVDKYATLPPIDLEKISLLEGGRDCTQVDSNSDFAIYQFPVTSCGTVVMEGPGVIIYENRLTSSYEVDRGDHGVITRDTSFDLLFQCRYFGTSVETLVAEVFPLDVGPLPDAGWGPIRVQMRLANGQCGTKGCNELDAAFTSFYTEADYPVGKVLRDPVYVEVQLLGKTDPNLVLTLGRCWATTSNQPHTLPQWDLLIDGCPYRDDRYTSALIPIGPNSGLDLPNHFKRFLFKMFTFVGTSSAKGGSGDMLPLHEQVYIHCGAAVCAAAPGRNCDPSCNSFQEKFRRRRDVQAENPTAEHKVVASVGPLNILPQPAEQSA
ncbi:zona pellucida sperm-binding protein 4-like [Echeneis naucrates]|uniref:zona pellucida sperm-binding protein 4-like n=1 Tax=Echeneis naucrates TaxID=173247 RepID=UPI001113FCE1|nr:zona pellucida sperm-binding protein 4-like [Echeneis naucrates]